MAQLGKPLQVRGCHVKDCDRLPRHRMSNGHLYCEKHSRDYFHTSITGMSPPQPKDRPTVYFLKAVGTRFIKIGKSADMRQRMSQLRMGIPLDIELLASWHLDTARMMDAVETALHGYCNAERHRGEWFSVKGRTARVLRLAQKKKFDQILAILGPMNFVLRDEFVGIDSDENMTETDL